MMPFIDRERQMQLLEIAWESLEAQFIVIYGRRRIGKTRLMLEFMKGKQGVFYIAEDENRRSQIGEFKEKMALFLDDDLLKNAEIHKWKDLFIHLERLMPADRKFYIVMDEFSYLIKNDKGLASSLQKFWDTFLSLSQVKLIVSGSLFGLMQEEVLSHSSPLYGRRTRDIHLGPLTFYHSKEFCDMDFEDKLKVYMVIGGVPEYLLKCRNYENAKEFMDHEFLNRDGYFYREPYFLLSQEFKSINTYFSMLHAIALGNTRPSEIANHCGIDTRRIYPYMENLIRHGFVRREVPVIGSKKDGIYTIKDVFFDFWFNFVHDNRENIERGDDILEDFNRYYGKRFEELIREELFHHIYVVDTSGRWWFKGEEIDIVGLNKKDSRIIFGECKWSNDVDGEALYKKLLDKSKNVIWRNEEREERYVLFARSFSVEPEGCDCIDMDNIREHMVKRAG